MKKRISMLLSILLLISSFSVSFADSTINNEFNYDSKGDFIISTESKSSVEYYHEMENYITTNKEGKLEFKTNSEKSFIEKFGKEAYINIISSFEQTNDLVDLGYISIDSNLDINLTEKMISESLSKQPNTRFSYNSISSRSISGVNKIEFFWWGFELYLDSKNTTILSNSMYGIAAVCVFLPEALVTKIVGACYGVSGAAVGIAGAAGDGIVLVFKYTTKPSIRFEWMRSQ